MSATSLQHGEGLPRAKPCLGLPESPWALFFGLISGQITVNGFHQVPSEDIEGERQERAGAGWRVAKILQGCTDKYGMGR